MAVMMMMMMITPYPEPQIVQVGRLMLFRGEMTHGRMLSDHISCRCEPLVSSVLVFQVFLGLTLGNDARAHVERSYFMRPRKLNLNPKPQTSKPLTLNQVAFVA
jgi:hypothetical protein